MQSSGHQSHLLFVLGYIYICYNYNIYMYNIMIIYGGFLKGGSRSHHVFQYWNGRFLYDLGVP